MYKEKELSKLKSDRAKLSNKLLRAIASNKDTVFLARDLQIASLRLDKYKKAHNILAEIDLTDLIEKIIKILKRDSFKVEQQDTEMHEFSFVCSNSGSRPQQLKFNTLLEIKKSCKPYSLDFVIHSHDKNSLVLYFW